MTRPFVFLMFACFSFSSTDAIRGRYNSKQPYGRLTSRINNNFPSLYEEYIKCKHQICSDPSDYPEKIILEIMENKQGITRSFGVILNSSITTLENRIFPTISSTPLCDIEGPRNFFPRVMRNHNMEWKYVVNVGQYQQIFTAEICSNSGQLAALGNNICRDVGGRCVQRTQDIYLLIFENGEIDFDKFKLYTTCECSLCMEQSKYHE